MRLEAGKSTIARRMVVYFGKHFIEAKNIVWVDDETMQYCYHRIVREYATGKIVDVLPVVAKASRIRINLHALCIFILD